MADTLERRDRRARQGERVKPRARRSSGGMPALEGMVVLPRATGNATWSTRTSGDRWDLSDPLRTK